MLALGVVTVLAIYLPVRHLQSFNHSAPALEMPSMKLDRVNVFWALPLVQASGFAALIWAYLGLVLGLVEAGGGRRSRWLPLTHAARVRLHRQISLLVLGLILMHAVMTALDAMGDNFLTALVPFMETYHPVVFAFDLGIFAFYLAILVGPSYYVRRRLGVQRWRVIHRLAGIVYVLALWHTLIIGDDVAEYSWLHPLIWLLQIPLLLAFARRMLALVHRHKQPTAGGVSRNDTTSTRGALIRAVPASLAALSAVASIAIIVLVATGSYATIVTANHF